jgi:vitamin B12 transporter
MRRILLATAVVLAACPAFAAETSRPTQTVIVNAAFNAAPIARIGTDLTVINRTTLEQTQAVTVVDALRDVRGVSYSRNGGVGATTSVRIRGAEGDQTALLIDGVRLSDPSTPGGSPSFSNLMIGNIERIDVLKGPQSTLYGSQALGGVVNVVTRKGAGPVRFQMQGELGSLDTRLSRGGVSGGDERWSGALSAGYFETGGFSAFDKRRGGKEDDGYRNVGVNGRVTLALTDHIEADLRTWYADARVDFDGFPPPNFSFADTLEYGESQELIAYAGLNISQLDGRLTHRLGATSSSTERENFNPVSRPTTTFRSTGETDRLEYQGAFAVTRDFQLIAGAEREEARYRTESPSSFNPNPVPQRAKADLSSFYVQALAVPMEGLSASFGVRADDQSQFGNATTARASVAWTPNGGATTWRANYGDGFKAPTLFQLFSDFGNPGLKPEEASSWDLGVEQAFFGGAVKAGIVTYQRQTKNQVDFASCFGSTAPLCASRPLGFYDNIQRTRANGTDATVDFVIGPRFELGLGYSQLNARNRVRGSANFNKRLARRAENTASLNVRYDWGHGLTTSATVSQVGDSFDNASNSVRLKGYTLVNLRAEFKLNEHYALYGRVDNAGDEAYSTTGGYGSAPREVSVGVRASF